MKYAINISDLIDVPVATFLLLSDVVPNKVIVEVEKDKIDGNAIMLECDNERALDIISLIRLNCEKHVLRCYKAEHSIWKRI